MAREQSPSGRQNNPLLDLTNLSSEHFSGKQVLEIGCGFGGFTHHYLEGAKCVYLIDKDADAIAHLRTEWAQSFRGNAAGFRMGKIESLPLPKGAFDIAVFSDSF
jgi:SAM-dependent methyltransferase